MHPGMGENVVVAQFAESKLAIVAVSAEILHTVKRLAKAS